MWIAMAGGIAGLAGWFAWERRRRRTHSVPGGLAADVTLPHAHELELYHNDFSLCSKKVRLCLDELELPHVSHAIDLIETGGYETLSRRFLGVNPAGTVPVLVHRGHPVYESHEQIAYAARIARQPDRLVPTDPAQRTVMERWVHLGSLVGDDPVAAVEETAGNCVPGLTIPLFAAMMADIPARRLAWGLLFHRLRARPLAFLGMKVLGVRQVVGRPEVIRVVQRSRAALNRHLDELEAQLAASGGPWIVGDQLTLADLGMLVILERLREAHTLELFLDESRPRLREYWGNSTARPSYRRALLEHQHPRVLAGMQRLRSLAATDPQLVARLYGMPPAGKLARSRCPQPPTDAAARPARSIR